jgi:hypothetical protein
MRKIFLFVISGLFIVSFAFAQQLSVDYSLNFKTMSLVPEPNAQVFLSGDASFTEPSFHSKFYKIIQFYEIPGQEEKNILKHAGVDLLDYLPNLAYFAAFGKDFDAVALSGMRIRSIIGISADYKLDPLLYQKNYPAHALLEGDRIRLIVGYFPDLDPALVTESLTAEGFQVTGGDDFGRFIYVTSSATKIEHLAGLPFVMFVEPVSPEPQPENYTGRTLHHSNAIASDYLTGRHYDGSNVHMILQDDGIIGPHVDYQGRIGAQYLTTNSGNHGDHCAGIIFAAGNIDPKGKGQAFGADLYVYSVSPNYPGFSAIPTVYNTLSIRVTSASYGDGCNAGYNSLARMLDQQVRTFPALFHVFSAGNSGSENCGYGAGTGWGNITGGHKMGKNVIAAANLDYQDNLASSSSRGPAHDGRIKPDICSKGTDVYSTVNPNDYEMKSGTSMACPAIAGTLAQLIQAYRELNGGIDPPAGLLKSIVLNTAEDLGNPGPDFKFGWGRINALRAVKVIEQGRFDSGVISQGASATHAIVVPAGIFQLRVMVYWTDYEATVNTTLALVNNLNITLTDPASNTWNPWVLNHFPHADSLNKSAARGVDNRNNMEQVTLDNPAEGTYILNIQGAMVPQGPQTYYVVYEFIPDGVTLTYPIGGESLVPGESETIRWDANSSSETISLELSLDNGLSWEPIATNLTGNTRYFNWSVPAKITAEAVVRVTRGTSVSQSEAPFSIMGIPCNINIDWVCDNALHLSWSEIPGAASYEVFKLGEKYMDPVGITTIPSFIVEGIDPTASDWLSVRAIGADGAKGRRAIAVEKTPGTFNCNQVDAMMASAPNAEWGVFQSCMALNAVKVPVKVKNNGLQPVTNPILHFQLDNDAVHTQTFTRTIEPDSTLDFMFNETIDLSDTGSHVLKTWVEYPPDLNPGNDTLTIPIKVIEGSSLPIGSVQTFDNWLKCLSAPICENYACALEEGWFNLANGTYDQHDWRTFSGNTPTAGTGPDFDHTTGTAAGKYLYIEPSLYCLNKMATVSVPCLDLTNGINPGLTLWYHAYGVDMGTFHVDLFDGSEAIMDVIAPVEGNQGNEWKKMEIGLTPWLGKVVGIRFRQITGCKEKGDFAIDDFSVAEVITSIGQGKTSLSGKLTVYPNPANAEIAVSLINAGRQNHSLQIIDMYGRVVYRKSVGSTDDKIHETVDVSNLSNGAYLIELKSDEKCFREKLIVR